MSLPAVLAVWFCSADVLWRGTIFGYVVAYGFVVEEELRLDTAVVEMTPCSDDVSIVGCREVIIQLELVWR
jgi:hypothetical protein